MRVGSFDGLLHALPSHYSSIARHAPTPTPTATAGVSCAVAKHLRHPALLSFLTNHHHWQSRRLTRKVQHCPPQSVWSGRTPMARWMQYRTGQRLSGGCLQGQREMRMGQLLSVGDWQGRAMVQTGQVSIVGHLQVQAVMQMAQQMRRYGPLPPPPAPNHARCPKCCRSLRWSMRRCPAPRCCTAGGSAGDRGCPRRVYECMGGWW